MMKIKNVSDWRKCLFPANILRILFIKLKDFVSNETVTHLGVGVDLSDRYCSAEVVYVLRDQNYRFFLSCVLRKEVERKRKVERACALSIETLFQRVNFHVKWLHRGSKFVWVVLI